MQDRKLTDFSDQRHLEAFVASKPAIDRRGFKRLSVGRDAGSVCLNAKSSRRPIVFFFIADSKALCVVCGDTSVGGLAKRYSVVVRRTNEVTLH